MSTPTNGTVKRVIAGVATAILVFLITMVIAHNGRIAALETDMENLKRIADRIYIENREEHRLINDKLDIIVREMKK